VNAGGTGLKTQIEHARNGTITRQMQTVAHDEGIDPGVVRERIATGSIVIM